MKLLVRLLLRLLYGFRAFDTAALSTKGPVLLVPNHTSWLDWLFLYAVLDDDWRCVVSSTTAQTSWMHRKIMINARTFPVDTASPYAVRAMADFLAQGGRLVLFAEGRITTTGALMKLFDGTGFLLRHTGAKVITCHLRGANRLPWVRHTGWTRWFPRVSAHFSPAMTAPAFENASNSVARTRTTTWLRDAMVRQQCEVELAHGPQHVPAAVAHIGAQIPGFPIVEDIALKPLSYRRLFTGADALASVWARRLEGGRGQRVGLMLPNVAATPVALLSLWSVGRVPAILNFSSGVATMLVCAQIAGVRDVVTSRAFLEKAKLDLTPFTAAGLRIHFLEDVRRELTLGAKLGAALRNRVSPGAALRAAPVSADDTAVVLFTSGSEAAPKAVELTHRNLVANIHQASAVIDLTDHDRFFNALPLFHSFGLTGGLLFPLVRGCYTFLYPTPLHYRIVPTMVYDRNCTVLMGTNTFLNGYARKAHAYDFNTLRFLVAGAEKVQTTTFETWARKFGVRILEGYGATECSPILSLNTRMDAQVGTAGRLLPGIEWKLEPVEGVEGAGRLLVRGPNIMKGYLNPEPQAAFAKLGGWYDTGDIVHVDDDGFLHIRGRMKRFAKISGEMVSLTAVEDALAGAFPQFGPRCQIAVVTRPDADKGEALIAVTNEPRITLPELRAAVRAKGLSNLAAPRELHVLNPIPKLGSGKVDHRGIQRWLAEQGGAAT